MNDDLTNLEDLHDDGDLATGTSTADKNAGTGDGSDTTPVNADTNTNDTLDSTNVDDNGNAPTSTPTNLGDYEPTEDVPAIEQYLSQYGILGGMIQFEDGETKHFNDLSEVEKFNILRDLSETNAPSIEDKFGLDDQEITLLNYLRGQEVPINEALENLAQQRAAQILALQNSSSVDVASMDDDAVTMKWLKETDPEASEEDLAEELIRQKESKLYAKNVAKLREQFSAQQAAEVQAQQAAEQQEFMQELETQRSEIATVVSGIDEVAGFNVSDEDKNEILHDLLEINEYGDSLFMEQVFSDPKELFKAAWFYKKGDAILDNLEKYYKSEIAKAYQAGKSEAVNGLSRTPISGSRTDNSQSSNNNNNSPRKENMIDVDDLHAND